MNISLLHSCLLLFCFIVGFIVVAEAETPRSSVSHKPRLVNMSLLLHIPPKLQRRYKIPELVDSSLPQQQKEVASNLKKWAMDQLLCQGHAKNNDKCDDQKEAIEASLIKESKNLDINKIIKPNTYLCSPDSVHAWNILGAIFLHNNNKDAITFGGNAHFNKITCLGQALKCDSTYALAWFNVAHELRQAAPGVGVDLEFFDAANETGNIEMSQVYSKHVTREECLVQTLIHAPWHSDAWFALGMSIKSSTNDTYVEVGPMKKVTKRECYVQAIETTSDERSRSLFAYWNNLGNVLIDSNDKVNVKGKIYSKLDCYVKVVKLNPDFSIGWFNLGAAMDAVTVEGNNDDFVEVEEQDGDEKNMKPTRVSKQEALLRALSAASNEQEENSLKNNPIFWINLANSIRQGEVKLSFRFNHNNPSKIVKKTFTAKDCYVKALELDGSSASAWNNLGTVLELSSSSSTSTKNPNNNNSSHALFAPGPGYLRRNDENGNNIKFSKKDCYVEAIRHSSGEGNNKSDPSSSLFVEAMAWKNLGDILGLASLIDGNGKVHTNVANMADLYLNRGKEDVEQQNENKKSHQDSASHSISSEFVEIDGKKYNKRRCFAEVIRTLDSNFIDDNIQHSPSSSSTFNLSPSATNTLSHSWTELGVIVYKESKMYRSVKVGRSNKQFNALDCFVRATQVDKNNHRAWYNLGIVLGNSTLADIASSISKSEVVSSIQQLCGVTSSKTDKDNSVDKYFYRQCFVQSLTVNPLHCSSWNALGNSLNRQDRLTTEPEDVVVFENGRIVKKRDAYLQAVQCGENFMKNEFTKDDALLQHVLSLSWFSLGTTMKNKKKDKITLPSGDDNQYTMQDCFVQSVQYDPTNADAWYNLGLTLELNKKVILRPFLDMSKNIKNGERSGYEVDRKLCFESYDAIKNGGRVQDLLIESGVKITSLNEIGTTRRSLSRDNVIKLKKEEKFIVEEDDDF